MDQTAIHSGAPSPKMPETGITAAPPSHTPVGAGSVGPTPRRQPKALPLRVLETMASLRITVTLFVLSLFLVFWGTLAQVDNGVWTVVQKYFRSFFVLIPAKVILFNSVENTDLVLPYPGGWTIGSLMLLNLLAAHAIRFKLAWNRLGIVLIHAGVIILMLGELVAGVFQIEGNMVIQVGQTVNYVINGGKAELAIVRTLDPKKDEVITIPAAQLKAGAKVDDDKVPFRIEVVAYMANSDFPKHIEGLPNPASRGIGRFEVAKEVPEISGVNTDQRHDAPSAYLKLTSRAGQDLGTWLVSALLDQPQWLEVDEKKYQLSLRFKQRPREFSFHLNKFEHKVFPGTTKPRDFHSYIHLVDPSAGVDWDNVEIYMNQPLRYRGETFYQSSWTTDPRTEEANGTILQVVRNPGWLMPYISCFVVGLGMLLHFGQTLYRFVNRRMAQ